MSDLENIRRFEYRPFRVVAGFHVDFDVEGRTVHGLCRDVSDAGIRAKFVGSVVARSSGLITLHHPTATLKLDAQVAYIENGEAGLVFLFKTPSECEKTMKFIASIADLKATSR
jgi:hypothetical protein